jgi:hypothetical protein
MPDRTLYLEKLWSVTRCPVCGAARAEIIETGRTACASFSCGARFAASADKILSVQPCPAGSDLAAEHLTDEAAADPSDANRPPLIERLSSIAGKSRRIGAAAHAQWIEEFTFGSREGVINE